MTFWTEKNFEPKRANRFKVSIIGSDATGNIPFFYAKDCAKPTAKINVTTHKVAGRSFNFPGSIEWNSIKITFVDDVDNKVIRQVTQTLAASNYPDVVDAGLLGPFESAFGQNGDLQFISKNLIGQNLTGVVDSGGFLEIKQLNANGDPVETWQLYNPILEEITPDGLDYGKDDLSTYSLTIRYDWAKLS